MIKEEALIISNQPSFQRWQLAKRDYSPQKHGNATDRVLEERHYDVRDDFLPQNVPLPPGNNESRAASPCLHCIHCKFAVAFIASLYMQPVFVKSCIGAGWGPSLAPVGKGWS